jgi:hypothetical protein
MTNFDSSISVHVQIVSDIGPQMDQLLTKKIQLSKQKQASWGFTNEKRLFDEERFV